jgi:hypothetical protein
MRTGWLFLMDFWGSWLGGIKKQNILSFLFFIFRNFSKNGSLSRKKSKQLETFRNN